MAIDNVLALHRQALGFERARLEAVGHNIAMANQPLAPGASAQLHQVSPQAFFGVLQGAPADAADASGEIAGLLQRAPVDTRTVHDPGHPWADAEGRVHYPAIDMVEQMGTLMSASRAYEANVKSFNTLRQMIVKSLEIGGRNA